MNLYFYVSDPGSECAGDRVKGNFWQMTCRRRSRHTERELQDIAERLFRVRTAIDHISGIHRSTFLRSNPALRLANRRRSRSGERGSCHQVLQSTPDRLSCPLLLFFSQESFHDAAPWGKFSSYEGHSAPETQHPISRNEKRGSGKVRTSFPQFRARTAGSPA